MAWLPGAHQRRGTGTHPTAGERGRVSLSCWDLGNLGMGEGLVWDPGSLADTHEQKDRAELLSVTVGRHCLGPSLDL